MPVPFSLDARQKGRILDVAIHGELDVATTPRLCEEVERALANGVTEVVIDCRHLAFLDSNGVGALLDLRKQLAARGGVLILFGPTGPVAQTLEVTGLDREFHVVAAPEQ
jgi:anti-sigma B factor antagonist